MPPSPPATLRLGIDAEALASNWRTLDRLSGRAVAGAAVKANCYGLGVDRCVPVLHTAGARDFFVAHWSEVEAVARHVPAASISVLHGPVTPEEAAYALACGARAVINSFHQAQLWLDAGGGLCHLMIDTGMNRLGIRPEEAGDPLIQALSVHTLMSHLSSADQDSAANAQQLAAFRAALPAVRHERASLANSAGLMLGSDYHFDVTRPGLALYGGIPCAELAAHIRPVARLEAAVIQRRHVRSGETIGYNGTFQAPRDMVVGIVSLGYADGFLRAWSGRGAFEANGSLLPLLGRVSMDMTAVDLANAPDLKEGDFLTIPYDLPDASAATGLSQYELLTTLGQRFAR
jgi:alanine racemase